MLKRFVATAGAVGLAASGLVASLGAAPSAGALTTVVPLPVPGQVTYFDIPQTPGGGLVDGQLPPLVYDGIAAGSDGNIWVAPSFGPVSAVSTTGVVKGSYPSAFANDVVAGPGGMWFLGGLGVGKIDSKGVVTNYPYPGSLPLCPVGQICPTRPSKVKANAFGPGGGGSIGQIALGVDGNIWFSGYGLGSVTPAGQMKIWHGADQDTKAGSVICPGAVVGGPAKQWEGIQPMGLATYFPYDPCPPTGTKPSGIWATFPAGGTNAWTDNPTGELEDTYYPSFVWKYRVGGQHTAVYPMNENETREFSNHLNVGPDNRMWIADQNLRRIYRTGLAGQAPDVNLPVPGEFLGSMPIQDVAWGPDKQMWFTAYSRGILGAAQIGRITATGAVQVFTLPDLNSLPGAITAGTDGNMWFIDRGLRKIGRISTGVVTGAPKAPIGLAAVSAGKGAMKVSWAVPTLTGGTPLKQFDVTVNRKYLSKSVRVGTCTTTWKHWAPASAPANTCTFKNLPKGIYEFRVTVKNWIGKTATSSAKTYAVKV